MTVFRHVEVGSSPKEPDFDLSARVGRRPYEFIGFVAMDVGARVCGHGCRSELSSFEELSFAYSVISNLSFSHGPQHCHEMTFELVHGADFVCVCVALFVEPGPIKRGPGANFGQKVAQKPKLKFKF